VRNIEKQKDERVQNHSCFESLINQNTFQDVKKHTHTHTLLKVWKKMVERVHAIHKKSVQKYKKIIRKFALFSPFSPFTTIVHLTANYLHGHKPFHEHKV